MDLPAKLSLSQIFVQREKAFFSFPFFLEIFCSVPVSSLGVADPVWVMGMIDIKKTQGTLCAVILQVLSSLFSPSSSIF